MRLITCHIGCISPRRQARKRRTLQTSKTHFVMLVLSLSKIKFSLSGGSKYKVLETRLRWRGRMRLEPCQIGSIRPRRQALGRRTLHLPRPWSHLEIQWFHSLSSCQIGWIWGYACDGGDVCDWSLAKSAAHVHDAKPEGDVHSILSNPYDLTCFIPSQTSRLCGPCSLSLCVDRRDLRSMQCAIPRGAPTLQSTHKRKL